MTTTANFSGRQPVNEVFSSTVSNIVKKESVHTYIIMPLNRSAYTVFDRDVLMDTFNAEPMENNPDVTDYDAAVANIKNDGGQDWTWFFETPDKEKPAEFTGSLKGCIRDMVQRLDAENGQENHYTVVARMYNMMDPNQLQSVVASAQAYPAAEFLNRQGVELETSRQRFLNEHMNENWKSTDPAFGVVCYVVDDSKVDPDRPFDRDGEYNRQETVARDLVKKLNLKCWNLLVERGYIEGLQLVVRNRIDVPDFNGDVKDAVVRALGDRYSSVCKVLATIANDNETDIIKALGLSKVKINSIFSLMGFARSYVNDKYVDIPDDREADVIALDEMEDEDERHVYQTVWDCWSNREAGQIDNLVVKPLVDNHGWKRLDDMEPTMEVDENSEVTPGTVNALTPSGTGKLLFGEGDSNWTKLEWQSAMSIGQRTAKSIEISERMFGENELNYLVKDGTDPIKFYETRTMWKAHPLVAIAYDMDFAAQYVNDYMKKAGIVAGEIEGGDYGTLLFTSTFTNGSRLFADDQGRVFLNLAFGGDNEYPEDIATNNATLLSWCTATFDPKDNPKASNFYTNVRNYLQVAMNRWADVRTSIKMAGADESAVLERFTTLMQNFPERRSPVDAVVSKFNNYIFNAYNPMENLNKCIDNLSKGNVTVI